MHIIGLSGYAQSGKDTVASILAERGYKRYAFADIMKDCLVAMDPYTGPLRLSDNIADYGWEKAKVLIPEIRRLVQVFGTEVGRNILGEDIWVQALINKIKSEMPDKVVITDVRFENEFSAVKNYGGEMWRVQRPGVTAPNNHSSEHSLEGVMNLHDHFVNNNGDLENLRDAVLAAEGLRFSESM